MFTSCGRPWSSRYDVRGTLIGSGLVVTTCEEPSGKVYVVRETLVRSLRRARNLDRVWSGRYNMRGTVGESLRHARNLDLVWSGRYDMRGAVRASLRRARNLGQVVYDVPGTLIGSGLVYDGSRNLDRLRSRFLGALVAGTRVASSPDSDLEAFSHNPAHAHVPYWWVNNPTLGEFGFTMIGRADIKGSKSNVAMNAWLPQANYPCGNFFDTSSFKFQRSKGSLGHAFTVRIRTGNQNQTSFYPSVPHEISVLVELILGHQRYLLTDVPPQSNSPPSNVFCPD
ncbi:hypothetical protein Tco_0563640 [Tanacetum coccineum]